MDKVLVKTKQTLEGVMDPKIAEFQELRQTLSKLVGELQASDVVKQAFFSGELIIAKSRLEAMMAMNCPESLSSWKQKFSSEADVAASMSSSSLTGFRVCSVAIPFA